MRFSLIQKFEWMVMDGVATFTWSWFELTGGKEEVQARGGVCGGG